jgi:citrate synthase
VIHNGASACSYFGEGRKVDKETARRLRTKIGTPMSQIDRLEFRGKSTLSELVGKATFTECVFLAVTGTMPTPQQTKILDACLVILIDHGITPSALVARLVADSVPTDVQVPIAAGLLMVGNKFMGTIAGAGALLIEGAKSGRSAEEWAAETVADHIRRGRRLPGFGHPAYFPDDPRTVRLFEVAAEAGLSGEYIRRIKLLAAEIERQGKRRLPLNATGAIGALLCEIGFPVAAMRGVAVISRSAGLLAHAIEELESGTTPDVLSLVTDAIPYEPDA